MHWQEKAKCSGQPLERFVLDEGPGKVPSGDRDAAAEAACRGCPVAAVCAAEALEFSDVGVVRGGVWIPGVGMAGARRARGRLREVMLRRLR